MKSFSFFKMSFTTTELVFNRIFAPGPRAPEESVARYPTYQQKMWPVVVAHYKKENPKWSKITQNHITDDFVWVREHIKSHL